MSRKDIKLNKQKRSAKKLYSKYTRYWINILGLHNWDIYVKYVNNILDASSSDAVANCLCDWRYLSMEISVDLERMQNFDKFSIEATALHELLHGVVNELQYDGIEHEERVVSELQKSFIAAIKEKEHER